MKHLTSKAAEQAAEDSHGERDGSIEIMKITPNQVVKVYTGKPGCGCGCRGTYSTDRGTCATILHKLQAAAKDTDVELIRSDEGELIYSWKTETRYRWVYVDPKIEPKQSFARPSRKAMTLPQRDKVQVQLLTARDEKIAIATKLIEKWYQRELGRLLEYSSEASPARRFEINYSAEEPISLS
jgi:hypothetical protein